MPKRPRKDYTVGYRKPPAHSRFSPGVSGNPKGRPKGSPNFTTVLQKSLHEKVVVTERGRRRELSKLEVTVKQLVNKAAGGDHKAMQLVLAMAQVYEARTEAAQAKDPGPSEADQKVMRRLVDRIRRFSDKGSVDEDIDK